MTNNSNSGNIVKIPPTTVDPNFFLPPGVVEFTYAFNDDTTMAESDPNLVVGEAEKVVLRPPNYIVIVSQTLRLMSSGQTNVDVVIDTEDVPGMSNYEVRISKA